MLRPYQVAALESVDAAFAGVRRVLLVAPTGAGKSVMLAEVVRRHGGPALVLAHRLELITQLADKLQRAGIEPGIIMAGFPGSVAAVQVASVQTLRRRELPRATLVVVDEAHLTRAKTYTNILAGYPDARVLGVTATPVRLDGRGLGELFDTLVVAAEPAELAAAGYLAPVTGYAYRAPDMRKLRSVAGDYSVDDAAELMSDSRIVGDVVGQWCAHAQGRRTVLFGCTVEHSKAMAAEFQGTGVRAEHLDGGTPRDERTAILGRLRSGETSVVCSVGVLSEGWDLPVCEVAILARPTKSLTTYLQQIGRVRRPVCRACHGDARWDEPACRHCGSDDIKRSCRLHDHVGNVLRHGLPDTVRNWELSTDRRKRSGSAVGSLSTCGGCYAVFEAGAEVCPVCGMAVVRAQRLVRTVKEARAVPLEELASPRLVQAYTEQAAFLAEYTAVAQARGWKPGSALFKFKERYGRWPSRAVRLLANVG